MRVRWLVGLVAGLLLWSLTPPPRGPQGSAWPEWSRARSTSTNTSPRLVTVTCSGGKGPRPPARVALLLGQGIELNRADAEGLSALPGIGPVLAERIIAVRAARGGFSTIAELAEVPGIGPRLLARLAPLLEVAPVH